MDNQQRIAKMNQLLDQALSPVSIKISDDSHLHAGHVGAQSGKGHFTLEISSSAFAGQSRVKQQQLVYQALGDMLQTDIHALVIKTSIPEID